MKEQPARRTCPWKPLQEDKVDQVKTVVNELRAYWLLTLRQIYYQFESGAQIENKPSNNIMLSKLIYVPSKTRGRR